ncbi:lipopolysaccharide biosynthesis protein [Methylobacterium flocculans]|uniref:lipopolysaccharide biosynthesis protein n=1 Tax=Methylobacterium flocculans TaxID=2984843 RepID=UPI0021F37770|nr:hypothetical protein [Methylobacterium sp. FF17]
MFRRALNVSWPLVDQAVVSIGTFVINLILARNLPQAEYGVFALLISVFLTFQLLNASLIFHPLIFGLSAAEGRMPARLVSATCLLTFGTSLPLAILVGAGLVHLGRGDLAPYAVAAFLAGQGQEALRRCLFAQLRHSAALPGDAVSYLGQCALVLGLMPLGHLGIETALAAMAGTSVLGMALQVGCLRFGRVTGAELRRVAADFWVIGRWILAYSAVTLLRLQVFPWALAATSGPAAAAMFQAAMNVLNVANPILLGLSNVIPQVAARALTPPAEAEAGRVRSEPARHHARSWRAVRPYLLLGLPLVCGFYGLALVMPGPILRVLYGAHSEYLGLTAVVQVLALSAMVSYGADMLSSFLHGVNAARTALAVNLTGAAVVMVLAVPAIRMLGLMGCALVLAAAGIVRLASAAGAVALLTRETRGSADLASLQPVAPRPR